MKLYSTEISEQERTHRGSTRLLNEALHAVQRAYLEAVNSNKHATIKITVTVEEPERKD